MAGIEVVNLVQVIKVKYHNNNKAKNLQDFAELDEEDKDEEEKD